MYFATPIELAGTLSAVTSCGYAIWRGQQTGRFVGGVILADWLASPLLENHADLHHAQLAIFAMDGVVTALLFLIAIRSDKYWPLWVTAFQTLELLMHVAMIIDHRVHARAYFIGIEISSYLMLIAIAVGTWLETPRKLIGRSAGADPVA